MSQTPPPSERHGSGPRSGGYRSGPPRSGGPSGDRRPLTRRPRRRMCAFCADKIKVIDYKDIARLRRYLSDRAKIEPRRKTGSCAKHQRMLTTALKRARHMALLPYTAEHVREVMSPQQRAAVGGPPPERPALRPFTPPPPGEPRPTESRPPEIRPPEARTAETRPAETRPAGARPADARPAEGRPTETPPPPPRPEPSIR